MSLGNFFTVDPRGHVPVSHPYQTKAGQTAIAAGEFVVQDSGGDVEYVIAASDGASNAQTWVGVAASADTVTSSADGVVQIFDDPQYLFRGAPTTSGNLATTVINTQVTLDVSASDQTVDENDTSSGTLIIRDYNADDNTIDVQMAADDHISKG